MTNSYFSNGLDVEEAIRVLRGAQWLLITKGHTRRAFARNSLGNTTGISTEAARFCAAGAVRAAATSYALSLPFRRSTFDCNANALAGLFTAEGRQTARVPCLSWYESVITPWNDVEERTAADVVNRLGAAIEKLEAGHA